jgi:hypothetical protein
VSPNDDPGDHTVSDGDTRSYQNLSQSASSVATSNECEAGRLANSSFQTATANMHTWPQQFIPQSGYCLLTDQPNVPTIRPAQAGLASMPPSFPAETTDTIPFSHRSIIASSALIIA